MSSEDALTTYIVSQVLDSVKAHYPLECPERLFVIKTTGFRLLRNDTMYIPEEYWGFKTTNDYRLHFISSLLLNQQVLDKNSNENPEAFFLNCGRALDKALDYVASLGKSDALLKGLMVYKYLYLPYKSNDPSIIISRDFKNDSSRFDCIAKAALCYRCDSTRISDWVYTEKKVDYRVVSVKQSPIGWKLFKVEVTLQNKGEMDVPFTLLLDFTNSDSLIQMNGFKSDTILKFTFQSTILKVIIDPYKKLFDLNESNQQAISTEFNMKRRGYLIITMLVWDIMALTLAFGVMLLLGIFIHSLTNLFYTNNNYWTALFILLFVAIKLGFPLFFFGFNMWGLVYNIFYITSRAGLLWLTFSCLLTSVIVYYAFQKDGVNMRNLGMFAKYMAGIAVLEPLLCGLFFVVR